VTVPVHDSVEVPEVPRVMLVGDRVQVNPVEGETESDSVTVPVNPCKAVTVIVDVPATLATALTVVGLAETLKSCIV